MSQSALAALLGKKPSAPSATPTLASVTAATPVAPPASAPTLPPTPAPAPAPAAAPSSVASSAAAPVSPAVPVTSSAPAAARAPAAKPEPGPNAVLAGSGGVAPPDTLAALLGDFSAAAGKAPRVNPPQAAAVLAGATAKEVAGHPEPAEVVEAKIAPVEKPADVLAAEQAPKSRRTAAVVQVELDAALKRIAQLEAQPAGGPAGEPSAPEEDLTSQAVELIEQLRAEAAVSLEDNRKAWARVAELEGKLESALDPDAESYLDTLGVTALCDQLVIRGFKVGLSYDGTRS